LDLAALKEQQDLDIATLKAQKDGEISILKQQLRDMTLLVQENEDKARKTLVATLKSSQESVARANAVKEDAKNAMRLMTEAYMNLNDAFHQLASWNTALRHQLDLAALRHGNHEHDMNDLWAEKQQLETHAQAIEEALKVMARDFAAARAYILNRIDTESAIVTIALLERDLRATRALLSAQGAAQSS
jgi:hypothetical protein